MAVAGIVAVCATCGVVIWLLVRPTSTERVGIWGRYVRVRNSAGDILRVWYLAAKDSKGAVIPPVTGRMYPTDYKPSDGPNPNDVSGRSVSTTHGGDWRRVLTDDDSWCTSNGGGPDAVLELDYGKDVPIDRIDVRIHPHRAGTFIVEVVNNVDKVVARKWLMGTAVWFSMNTTAIAVE